MRPLAIDGAAPSTTTNVIAPSVSLKSRMASGNQAIDGIVCRPVIIEPTAERAIFDDTTMAPMTPPMTQREGVADGGPPHRRADGLEDGAVGDEAAELVEHRRRRRQHVLLAPPRPHDDLPDQQGEGDGGQLRPDRQPQLASAIRPGAASGVRRRRRWRCRRGRRSSCRDRSATRRDQLRAWASTSSRSWSVTVAASVATSGESMRRGRSMSTSKLDVDAAGARRHDDDPIAEAGRLADVVGHEEHGQLRASGRGCRARRGGVSRVIASRAPNGSSISSTSASWASARASAPRWRMPPESWCGRFLAKRSEVHRLEQLRRPLADDRPCRRRPASSAARRSPATVSHGNSAASWNISAVRPVDVDRAGRRRVEPGDEVEDRRLAAAGRTDEAHELAADATSTSVERVTACPCRTSWRRASETAGARDDPSSSHGAECRDPRRRSRLARHSPFASASPFAFKHLVEDRQVVDAGRLQVDGVEQADGLGVVGRRLQRRGDRVEREARGSRRRRLMVASARGLPVSSPMPALTSVWASAGSASIWSIVSPSPSIRCLTTSGCSSR